MVYNIPLNATHLSEAYVGIANTFPTLFNYILLFEFFVILLGGLAATKRSVGFSNVPLWLCIASLTTTLSAMLLMGVTGLIGMYTLTVCFSLTIGSTLLYFLTDKD